METIAFIDCSAGVAGDMLLGALIDAGAPLEDVVKGLSSLRAIEGEWALRTTKVWQGPGRIAGTKVHVDSIYKHKEAAPPVTPVAAAVAAPIESHAHDHSHDHSHDHDHSRSHDHSHDHGHDHSHDRGHDHSHEASEPVAAGVLDLEAATEYDHGHGHDYGHSHDHGHDRGHSHGHGHNHSHEGDGEDGGEPMRNLDDIKQMILMSTLSEWVKTQSIAVFTLLAQAEAHTHGTTLEAIHFHEVGAIDSIVDTVGCVLAMDLLGVRQVYSSFLPFSSGAVKCMHGILPVPPPATFRLMIGIPVCPAPKGAKGELVTPTGVSLVKALSTAFGEPPAFVPTHTGVGAGTKEFPFHANIVRVAIGTKVDPNAMAKAYLNPSVVTTPTNSSVAVEGSANLGTKVQPALQQQQAQYSEEDVVVLETNLDDLNPQVVGFVLEKLLNEELALDVWTQPIQMKKSRPGICLNVLCQPERETSVLQVLFQETTTLGVRKKILQRVFLRREFIKIHAFERHVAVKLAFYGDKLVNIYPEYEECKEIAKDTGIPLLDVIHKVQSLATTFIESQ